MGRCGREGQLSQHPSLLACLSVVTAGSSCGVGLVFECLPVFLRAILNWGSWQMGRAAGDEM